MKTKTNKELKAFRKICKNLNSYEFTNEYKKNKKLIETALKALEIIKEKRVDCSILYQSENLEEYNSRIIISYSSTSKQLTQEEYNLLKDIINENKD